MFSSALVWFVTITVTAAVQDEAEKAPPVVETTLGTTFNVHRSGELWFAGQFQQEDIQAILDQGIERVITLRMPGEVAWDEKALVEENGLEFVEIPFRQPETLTDDVFGQLRTLLASDVPTLFHCGSANRVGGSWLPFRVLDQGVPLEAALAEARTIGLKTAGYEERALAYIGERQKESEPQSVKEGINANFKDENLDVDTYLGRFEVETREIYASRQAIVEATGVQPGMAVADVGAGTGLFSFLLADAAGEDGWIFAVDIAPKFLQHICTRATEEEVFNVTSVLCTDTSVCLPPASVDLAFVCDTYHHFEYPQRTLASIHRALKPGGRLVVIDFERIPGVTREWILDHVRAGKEVFRAEIEAAGFTFSMEQEIPGLEENYCLEFLRR